MSLKESVAKAQLQLLGIQSVIQAEGWDKDPDYIKRDKGRFSSNKGSSPSESDNKSDSKSDSKFEFPDESEYLEGISRIKGLTKKDMDKLQEGYEKLKPEEIKAYEDFANSPAVKQMQEDFSSAMQSVSADATKVYDDVIKKVKKEPEPKEHLNVIQQAIKDHPTAAKVGAVALGVVAILALHKTSLSSTLAFKGMVKVSKGKNYIKKAEFAENAARKVGATAEANRQAAYGNVAKIATGVEADYATDHGLMAIIDGLQGGLFGLGAIALNNEVSKNEKEQAATRFGNQLDLKAFAGGEKQKQDFTNQIVEAVDKASKDFNKAIQK